MRKVAEPGPADEVRLTDKWSTIRSECREPYSQNTRYDAMLMFAPNPPGGFGFGRGS